MGYPPTASIDNLAKKTPYALPRGITSTQTHITNIEAWWKVFGEPLWRMLNHAGYSLEQQQLYLTFLHSHVIPELGPSPYHTESTRRLQGVEWSEFSGQPTPPHTPELRPVDLPSDISPTTAPEFKSFMTDDHTPIELSWQFPTSTSSKPRVRFSIDPVLRQTHCGFDYREAMGIFQDISRSNLIAPGCDLEWSRISAGLLTSRTRRGSRTKFGKEDLIYPSQYFIGFDYTPSGIVLKSYFMPATLSARTYTSKRALITKTIAALSATCHSNLMLPWTRTLAFLDSLPQTQYSPDPFIFSVDCVEPKLNRAKVYVRTPMISLRTVRMFLTLGKPSDKLGEATKSALKQVELLWRLLFPECDSDEAEVPSRSPEHLTSGLLFYYELLPGHSEPFPKVYIPVRHLCRNDEEIVSALVKFYKVSGRPEVGRRYADCVRNIWSHRSLGSRAGIHTYITLAAKKENVEVTAYLNPECYAPERNEYF